MNKKIFIGVLVVAVLVLGGFALLGSGTLSLGARQATGPIHTTLEVFREGLFAGRGQELEITATGDITTTGDLTIGSSGTGISNYQCATATWNPGNISSSTVASTSLLLAGSALGNVTLASFDAVSSTAEWIATGKVTAVGSTTIFLEPQLGTQAYLAGLDLGTSTARTCIIQ